MSARPQAGENSPYFDRYIDLVPDGEVMPVLRCGVEEMGAVIGGLDESRGGHRYAAGKWSIREVIGHLIDCERIFAYRLMRIARGDTTPLPSFDENAYVEHAGSDARTLADLSSEFGVVRAATLRLLESLPGDAWTRRGTAGDNPISVRALAYITAGHCRHHMGILKERYLS